jgi:perosamine synthetase
MSLAAEFVSTIRAVVGHSDEPIGLHVPEIGDLEKKYILECLDSTFVSSVGAFIPKLETRMQEITGAKHAIAVSNGTVGLQVAMFLAGVEPGDEVIIPTLSFIATANAVSHCGAVPYFVDSEISTLGMSPAALRIALASFEKVSGGLRNPETGRRIAAIVPMHTLGHPVAIEAIVEIAAEYGVPVVEDAAESLGSFVDGKHTGTFGLTGMISFNGNKIVTTGGGGVILTNDDELGRRAKHLTTTAKLAHKWEFEHDEVAWNYRMPNLNAALGMAQLDKYPRYLAQKRVLADKYAEAFAGVSGLTFVAEPAGTSSNYWLCAVKLDSPSLEVRDSLMSAAHEAGLLVRPMWNLLHKQRMYAAASRGDLAVASDLHASLICLPSTPALAGQGQEG